MDQRSIIGHEKTVKPKATGVRSELNFAARRISESKEEITSLWEKRVREQVPGARGKTSFVIVNSLGIFLDELAINLIQKSPSPEKISDKAMSKIHGGDRATFSGYFLPQLLIEFSILRQVMNEVLLKDGALTFEVRTFIDTTIDSAISKAATEFTEVQQAAIKSALLRTESSNRDLEQFAAVAAHDLKSPLATVSGFLEIFEEDLGEKVSTDALENMRSMRAVLNRMQNLIDQLLEYASIAGSNRPFLPVRLEDTVRTAIQNLKDSIEKTHAHVTYSDLPQIMGNSDLLTQLFQNLIANAIKFRGLQPPEIQIGAKHSDGIWLLSVRDNGIGFDPKDKEEIFGLYKRLKTNEHRTGTGIGLATCRKVVELHHGRIWADSQPGVGSVFFLTLPKTRDRS